MYDKGQNRVYYKFIDENNKEISMNSAELLSVSTSTLEGILKVDIYIEVKK